MHSSRWLSSALVSVALVAAPVSAVTKPIRKAVPAKAASAQTTSTSTQASPPTVEPAQCQSLHHDYEELSKILAKNQAGDAADDDSGRAIMRKTENSNAMTKASLVLDLMRGAKCRLPGYAPSADRYREYIPSCQTLTERVVNINRGLQSIGAREMNMSESPCDTNKWPDKS